MWALSAKARLRPPGGLRPGPARRQRTTPDPGGGRRPGDSPALPGAGAGATQARLAGASATAAATVATHWPEDAAQISVLEVLTCLEGPLELGAGAVERRGVGVAAATRGRGRRPGAAGDAGRPGVGQAALPAAPHLPDMSAAGMNASTETAAPGSRLLQALAASAERGPETLLRALVERYGEGPEAGLVAGAPRTRC